MVSNNDFQVGYAALELVTPRLFSGRVGVQQVT
jgi:hypothetical protein